MQYVVDVEAYATQQRPRLADAEESLIGSVRYALRRHGEEGWSDALVARVVRLMERTYREESGRRGGVSLAAERKALESQIRKTLKKVDPDPTRPEQARSIAASLASAAISGGILAAAKDSDEVEVGKVWVTTEDERVRPTHRAAHGQMVPVNEKFEVGGVKMNRPGDMSAPIDEWINCRCVVAIQSLNPAKAAAADITLVADATFQEEDMTDLLAEFADAEVVDLVGDDDDMTVPWYGVLAPEDVMSGDKRKFSPDSLTWRDLPLPLSWQKVNADGHDGSVIVGRIDEIWRDAGLIHAKGVMLYTPEADEAVGMMSEGGLRGVSVDVDSASMTMEDADGNALDMSEGLFAEDAVMNVTKGRICGATLCAIPAFMEASVYLGIDDPAALVAAGAECIPCQYAAGIDEGSWDGSPGGYTDQEWYDATIIHLGSGADKLTKANNKVPIYTPGGKLSRAGVHAAAGRIGQTDAPPEKISAAKATLRGAYDVLGEEAPEGIKAAEADVLEFGEFGEFVKTEDGPGWLTHPVDTQRLRHYWTKGKGALKIRWGVPGDFNRCRLHLAKYIKPQYLNGYCANRHYDALGFWPGRPTAAEVTDFSGPAMHLVAAGDWSAKPPREWFENPNLTGPSAIAVTEDGRVFGHLAVWGQCHIGFGQTEQDCVLAPSSPTDYAYFRTGAVLTDDGEVAVGHITMGTGHAGERLRAAATVAHYDNTGTVVADVACGEDAFGIYVAGAMRPDATEQQKYELRSATLSGDWRWIGTGMELVAALGVNVPGFPIPRTQLAADGGRQISLVASGVVKPSAIEVPDVFDIEKFAQAVATHMASLSARREKMAALKKKTGRDPVDRMKALAEGRK